MARKYKVVLFDVDGTVVMSEARNRDVIERLAAEHGANIEKQDWSVIAGNPEVQIWDWLKAKFNNISIEREDFSRQCRKNYLTSSFNIVARPGIKKAIRYLKEQGVIVAAVSNSPRNLVEHGLKASGCFDDMALVLSENEVLDAGRRPKPAPDPYLMAAEMLGVLPEECAVFEDSGTGVKSGVSARMTVIQFCDEEGQKAASGVDYVVRSEKELGKVTKKLSL